MQLPRLSVAPRAADLFVRLALVMAVLSVSACGDAVGEEEAEVGGVAVRTQTVETRDVKVFGVYPGRARGAREVEVRARVEGVLEARTYDEGAKVDAGDRLFRISPQPYRVVVQRAEAQLAEAAASANQAQREWDRVEGLFDQDAVSARERDQARSVVELADAQRQTAEANVAAARLDLGYTDVKAPIVGVTGLETVPEGSLVSPGTLLTQITQLDPIHLRFSFPEAAALTRAQRQSETTDRSRLATLILNDGSEYPAVGDIDFTNAGVDAATGSITARAVFSNPDGVIRPGQFLRVRVLLEALNNVVTVPETAIAQGAEGTLVYLMKGGKAVSTPVTLGPLVDGQQVVTKGLRGGERLVASGMSGLSDGDEIYEADQEGEGAKSGRATAASNGGEFEGAEETTEGGR